MANQPTVQIEINIEEEYKKYIEKNKKPEPENRIIVIDMNKDDMEDFNISRVDDKNTFQM
jgi:hypothetical protein